VRFDYYRSLSPRDRRTYDASDAVTRLSLPKLGQHRRLAVELERALFSEERKRVTEACQALTASICAALGADNPTVKVLPRRPKNAEGELHGLYTREADGRAQIEVWMRTSERRQVVRFKTFLRTLVHEICHHLDFTVLRLRDTYHTEGFFRRESSLVRQLLPETARVAEPSPAKVETREPPAQLSLFD